MLPRIILFLSFIFPSFLLLADETKNPYSPSKVVYDLSSPDPAVLKNILDRISYLQNIYNNDSFEASIVVVIHEGAIPLFVNSSDARKNIRSTKYKIDNLIARAESLTVGDIIKFKVCEASARLQGFTEADLPEFTPMVPMADAEIIKLQRAGYAYIK